LRRTSNEWLARVRRRLCFYDKSYTGRGHIPVLSGPAALEQALAGPGRVAVIGRDRLFYDAFGNPLRHGYVAAGERAGHRRMLLLTNWRASGRTVVLFAPSRPCDRKPCSVGGSI
jgi:hypothetical protein